MYGSSYGHTAKISQFISQKLVNLHHEVDCYDSQNIPVSINPQDYDAFIVGGSVITGRYHWKLRKWVKSHAAVLNARPSTFFSVCLGILQSDEAVKQQEIRVVKDFFFRCNWEPKFWTIFAGSIVYSKYNWFVKQVMRRIAKKASGDIDMSRDYEFTDWDEVTQFAQSFSQHISKSPNKDSVGTRLH